MTPRSPFRGADRWTGTPYTLQEIEDPAHDGAPAISIRSLRSALRRRRRLWVTTAIVGLLLGSALHVIVPSKVTSISQLYLVELSGGPPGQAMSDEVALLESQAVADRAVGILHSQKINVDVVSPYKGTGVSPSIMAIKLSAPSAAAALAENNALAAAFLAIRTSVENQRTQVQVNGLESQIEAVKGQIQQLTDQINSLPAPVATTGPAANHRADLNNQLASANTQLTGLQAQVQQDVLAEAAIGHGSRILDPAIVHPASKKKVIIKDGLSGLVAGLALGVIIVILTDLLSDRLRRRSEVAAVLGAPVELSVGRLPRPRWFAQARMQRALKHPGPDLLMVQRRLREHLESASITGLSLIEIESAQPAALALTMLAQSLASEGKRVMLVDAADGRPIATLLASEDAVPQGTPISVSEHDVTLLVAPDDPAEVAWMEGPEDADVILTLATVDPALGAEHISTWVSDVVVMVRAGAASPVQIDAVGRLLRQSLIGVWSAILIEADSDDNSAGIPEQYEPVVETAEPSLRAVEAGDH
jgi:capsular polysaccharide biosynthesis protein